MKHGELQPAIEEAARRAATTTAAAEATAKAAANATGKLKTRLSKGEKLTACSSACPADVRIFGDLASPDSEVYRSVHQLEKVVWVMRAEAGTKPNIFYTKG